MKDKAVTKEAWCAWQKIAELQDKILVFKDSSMMRDYALYIIDSVRDYEKGIVNLSRVDRTEVSYIVERLEDANRDLADELRKIIKKRYKDRPIWVYWQKKEVVPFVSIDNLEATTFFTPEDVKTVRGGEVNADSKTTH